MAYNDEEIKKVIQDQLSWDSRIGQSEIDIKVYDGNVTLDGTVSSFAAREAAEIDALMVPGVENVNNHTVIRFPGYFKVPPDSEIKARVLNRFLWNPNVPASDIDVSVSNGEVVLTGIVDQFWKKVRAEEIAYDIGGVVYVNNELVVVPSHEYGDRVIAEDIMAAMKRNPDIDQDKIELDVDKGVVTLNGIVDDFKDIYAAYHIVKYTKGVREVINLLKVQRKAA
jgi:osmotically-inducible protein OsmY